MTIDLDTLSGRQAALDVACHAAREAGKIVLPGWRRHPTATHKGVVDLVTNYDFESERYLRRTLREETPFAFVGEEEGGQRAPGARGPTWFVDPLDGTTNFVHGHPFVCISIGLVVGSTPILGVVHAPALGSEWAGGEGLGAIRNGEVIVVSRVSEFDKAFLATGFPYDRRTSPDDNLDAFASLKKKVQGIRRCGSAALDLCMVADGTYDGYWERKLRVWDLAAGAAIVRAAGGRLSNFKGGEDDVTSGELVASNGPIHDAFLSALQAVPSIRDAPHGWSGM
jgi:myo-inositol-1(or 4)-monophosphatase